MSSKQINNFSKTVQGVLIIDDYISKGSKKAVDEYFHNKNYFFHRIDDTGNILK